LSPATNTTSSPPVGLGAAAQSAATTSVRVAAPGRLHLGFLDPSASLGRRFGSLGLVIDGPQTVLELGFAEPGASADLCSAAPHLANDQCAAELARVRHHLASLRLALGGRLGSTSDASPVQGGLDRALRLHLADALPAHAGLGSGTQLGLAVGRAFCELHGIDLPTAQIAQITGRGLRSGVGIAGFDAGGLLVDAGPPPAGARGAGRPAPLLSRIELPADWRVLLVLDPGRCGLSGDAERAALARLAPLPREAAAEICHEVVMRVLAGAASDDFDAFAAGLNRVQRVLGEHFAPAQGGSAYTSAAVERLVTWLAQRGSAVGQSSWGPTGFAVFPNQASAEAGLAEAHLTARIGAQLQVSIVSARTRGAEISRGLTPGGAPVDTSRGTPGGTQGSTQQRGPQALAHRLSQTA
jgi:beta-RFAP synthase